MSEAERAEFDRLDDIKDDLFLYKTEITVSSLARDMRAGYVPTSFDLFIAKSGLKVSLRQLRDVAVIFSYNASGQNLFVAQLMAAHAGAGSTALYLRRRSTLNRIFDRAAEVFGKSLDLIGSDTFDVARLRRVLTTQGLDDGSITNLLDVENTTRWGNRCADPANPPRGFDGGRTSGDLCRGQDCIDGCPHARWFRDSIEHVARNLVAGERLLDELGAESTEASSLPDRLRRCKTLLARWPKDEISAAIAAARADGDAASDLFLGGAL